MAFQQHAHVLLGRTRSDPKFSVFSKVHAYVGDEVIVTWPLSDDTDPNVRSLRCFFAAQDTMADLAPAYTREFCSRAAVPRRH